MKSLRYGENVNVLPILAPVDAVATAVQSQYVDLKYVQHATLLVNFGNLTSDSTDGVTVTLQASTAGSSNATELTVAFPYRLLSAVATNTAGAITNATTDGVAVTAADDNKALLIDVDPAVIANLGADYRYIRLVCTPNAEAGISLVGATAFLEPRYAGNAIPSST